MDHYKFDLNVAVGIGDEDVQHLPGFSLKKKRNRIPFLVAGVDEAGRGPLAGPLVVAAVILPAFPRIKGLNDSKKLTEIQREKLFPLIKKTALSASIIVVEPAEIDELNIFGATMKAMKDAIHKLKVKPDLALIDGNQKPRSHCTEMAVVKGDTKSAAIMAASVLAKVTRDRIMLQLHEQYPNYGFDIHKGYAVQQHLEMLEKWGPCPSHRRSYEPIKNWRKQNVPSDQEKNHDRGVLITQQQELF